MRPPAGNGPLPLFSVQRIDHVVLRVVDVERAITLYKQVLGMPHTHKRRLHGAVYEDRAVVGRIRIWR